MLFFYLTVSEDFQDGSLVLALVSVVDGVAVLEVARQEEKDAKNDVETEKTSCKRSVSLKTRPKEAKRQMIRIFN